MSKLEKLKEIFFLFAKDNYNEGPSISFIDLKFVINELKIEIKENELQMEFDNLFDPEKDEDGNPIKDQDRFISYDQFYTLMTKLQEKKDTYEATLYGLQHLDKEGKGLIDGRYFRYLMNQYGEKMPVEDIQEIIKLMDPDVTGKINVKEFADVVFGREKPRQPTEKEDDKKKKKGGKGKK